jgi:hypothetical protein
VGSEEVRPRALADVLGHENLGVDRNAKEDPRLLPQEALIRSYLRLFGGLAPIASQMALRQGSTTLFDRWLDYLGALGIPNHRIDQPRGVETSTLMLATFERIGIALCDKSLQHDLRRTPALPINERYIFAFDAPPGPLTEAAFNDPFDTLHRTFLGYPASLADAQRTLRYLALYNQVYAAHSSEDAGVTGFTPSQAGWAAVCYGLLRHPEFQTY